MLLQCPNCQAIWGIEEIDWQQCDCCGWPDVDNDDVDDDDVDDDYDQECEDNNPNDTKNL